MNQLISVSLVLFSANELLLENTLVSLRTGLSEIAQGEQGEQNAKYLVALICNDNHRQYASLIALLNDMHLDVISGHGNVGFGRGHSLAMQKMGNYHLVLNPDVEIAPDALASALAFMESNPQCGLLAPKVLNGRGNREYLCRRYPSVLDIALRGFAPEWLRRLFRVRLDRYEMRDVMHDEVVWDPPLVSGCFMLFRSSVLKQLGGFDPDFFLYFEDYDLSLRTAEIARIAYVPEVQIIHYGGGASRKGLKHIWMFCRSAVTFFNKHGWRWV